MRVRACACVRACVRCVCVCVCVFACAFACACAFCQQTGPILHLALLLTSPLRPALTQLVAHAYAVIWDFVR